MLTHHYRYDPLNRLTHSANIQRFYNHLRMTTEIQGVERYSVFQSGDTVLAQTRDDAEGSECSLLVTGLQRSVLHEVSADGSRGIAYNAYGHCGERGELGFNGERADPMTGHYLLGNGYRAFNPILMRFNSPDSWSPFGQGGINAYGYCQGDPANKVDPTGHTSRIVKFVLRAVKIMKKAPKTKIEFFENGIPKPRQGVPAFTGFGGKTPNDKKLYPGVEASKARLAANYDSGLRMMESYRKNLNKKSANIESLLMFEEARAIDNAAKYFDISIPDMPLKQLNGLVTKGFEPDVMVPLREVVDQYAWLHGPRARWPDIAQVRQ